MQVGGPNLAILDGSENGIQFGAEGLIIAFQYGKEKLARSKLGSYYAKLPDGTKSLFANSDLGKGRATLKDLKVQWSLASHHYPPSIQEIGEKQQKYLLMLYLEAKHCRTRLKRCQCCMSRCFKSLQTQSSQQRGRANTWDCRIVFRKLRNAMVKRYDQYTCFHQSLWPSILTPACQPIQISPSKIMSDNATLKKVPVSNGILMYTKQIFASVCKPCLLSVTLLTVSPMLSALGDTTHKNHHLHKGSGPLLLFSRTWARWACAGVCGWWRAWTMAIGRHHVEITRRNRLMTSFRCPLCQGIVVSCHYCFARL